MVDTPQWDYLILKVKNWFLCQCLALCDPIDCSPPDSSVHGILQIRILEWVAISSSRGSSPPSDQIRISLLHLLYWQVSSLPLIPPGGPLPFQINNCLNSKSGKVMEAKWRLFPVIKEMGDTEKLCPGAPQGPAQYHLGKSWEHTVILVLCDPWRMRKTISSCGRGRWWR